MSTEFLNRLSTKITRTGNRLLHGRVEVWIDVGAHLGETTFPSAEKNPHILVYAFEPILELALQMSGRLSNFHVLPYAVSEQDGCADFYINTYDSASSLLPFDEDGLLQWKGGSALKVERKITVPTIRLDTFMQRCNISHLDYLKIDAQGADLFVLKSAGSRLRDIDKICVEAQISPTALYHGSAGKSEIISYMNAHSFHLAESTVQSYGQEENLVFVRDKHAI